VVDARISGDKLTLEFLGWSKLWAFRSRLEIPLASIKRVYAGEPIPEGFYLRVLGTGFPGVISAGVFTDWSRWSFFDLRADRTNVLVLELPGWKYDVIAVEVSGDAFAIAESINKVIESRTGASAIS
jgi:hypothetical protein